MTASDYSINLPYDATSYPYSSTRKHKGDDRPCPAGTAIIINGKQIGLTGATGYVFGAHLHIQEWKGDYANTRKPVNSFIGGVVTNIDAVGTYPNNKNDGTQGDGSFGKFITIQTPDGWNDSYCHLSAIDVKIGEVIGADMISKEAYIQMAEAASFMWGDAFNYDPNKPIDELAQLLWAYAPKITKEMESALADSITGIKGVIGDGYNSPYVGQTVGLAYPDMVKFWQSQPKTDGYKELDQKVYVKE